MVKRALSEATPRTRGLAHVAWIGQVLSWVTVALVR